MIFSQCGQNGGLCPQPPNSYVLGLGTGALTAAAVSCCRTISELLPLAVHTVAIALRTGLCASEMARCIEPIGGKHPAPWSIIASGRSAKTLNEVLIDFSRQRVRLQTHLVT